MTVSADGTIRIGVLLFEDVEELDAVGPWEVLAFWAQHVADAAVTVTSVSRDGRPVRCAKGLTIGAERSWDDLGPLDVLVHPGGRGVRRQLGDPGHLEWVRSQRAAVPLLASVCTGALVYAAAGLLQKRSATTHWRSLDRLGELDPTIDVRADARFVDEGDIITSAGVSAGLDMALHLVARLGDPREAAAVRRGIQYEPPASNEDSGRR